MSTVGSNYKTLTDVATDAGAIQMVEILQRKNALMRLLPWIPCNDGSGHKTKIRTGYPTPTWRRLYEGIAPTKGTMVPVRESTGMLQDYGEVDYEEYILAGDDRDVWRMHEDFAHIEGMSNAMETALWYGNTLVDPEKFNGLAARYNSLSTGTAATAENVITAAGASTDNTSIWLLGLGPQSLAGLYPKGSQAGLQSDNLGKSTKEFSDGTLMEVLRSHYKWNAGITLPDWRCTGRIPNIDVSDVRGTVANQKALITYMIQLAERCEEPNGGQRVFCFNKTIFAALRIGILEKITNNLTWETVEGKKVMMFDEMQCIRADGISNGESVVA